MIKTRVIATTTMRRFRGFAAVLLGILAIVASAKLEAFAGALIANSIIKGVEAVAENNLAQDAKKRDMVLTRVFDAPVERVWKAWTNEEDLMQWWGPTGFTSPLAKVDLRVGKYTLVCMRAPKEFGGKDMYTTWTYQKIEPLKRLEFISRFSDKDGNTLDPAKLGLPPGIPMDVPQVVTFKSLGENKTEITVTESGYTTDQIVEISKLGLQQCLDKMAAIFARAAGQPPR
jgi:uncharacterized protein YndB with AHSA1/START domain